MSKLEKDSTAKRVLERCFTAKEREYLDTEAEFTRAVGEMESLEALDYVINIGVILLEKKHLSEASASAAKNKEGADKP